MNSTETTTAHLLGKNFRVQSHDDATWILSSAFVVFTMQSGFGLLESGSVSSKNEVNIMVKNAVDVICGGLTYWMFGYGLSFGEQEGFTNPFSGWGDFFVTADEESLGYVYSKFFFQASFATTATTIVSGAMAERTKLEAYIIFSFLNTFVYCFPAHWVWGRSGWLYNMGVVDIAGAGPVHLVGGVTGLVSTLLLKPRHRRFVNKRPPQMGSPTNAMLGMFMLWWGWLGFNCGSTFGISGLKWKLAARSAVSTICASTAGGIVGLFLSYVLKKRQFDVSYLINSILGSLVGITATCAIAQPWEALLIGVIGACLTIAGITALEKLKIDDPVGCVGVHAVGGAWSLLAAGFVARKDQFANELQLNAVSDGVFNGGGLRQLGIQTLSTLAIVVWTFFSAVFFLKTIDIIIGLRVPLCEEILGADISEHGIGPATYDKKTRKVIYDDEPDDVEWRRARRRSHTFGRHTDRRGELDLESQSPSPIKSHKRTCLKGLHTRFRAKLRERGRPLRQRNSLKYRKSKKQVDSNENIFHSEIQSNGIVPQDGFMWNSFSGGLQFSGEPLCSDKYISMISLDEYGNSVQSNTFQRASSDFDLYQSDDTVRTHETEMTYI